MVPYSSSETMIVQAAHDGRAYDAVQAALQPLARNALVLPRLWCDTTLTSPDARVVVLPQAAPFCPLALTVLLYVDGFISV